MAAAAEPRRKRVLLCVTGSVAAVKWEEIALALLGDDCDLRVVHTHSAMHFASVASYAPAVSAAWRAAAVAAGCAHGGVAGADGGLVAPEARLALPCDAAEWAPYAAVGACEILHLSLRAWADLLLVAPASAHTLAKLANGLADNLLTCTARAWPFRADGRFSKPVLLAPAMNPDMWHHRVTALHLSSLRSWGAQIIEPVEKRLACGETGIGGLAAVCDIVAAVRAALAD